MSNVIALNPVQREAREHTFTEKLEVAADTELFTVDMHDIQTEAHGAIPNKKALIVDGECVNVVSDKYEVHQPNEILAQFREVAANTGLEINQVIPSPHRGGLIITAKYNEVSFLDEKHDMGVMLFTTHCSSYSTFVATNVQRIFCMNQIPAIAGNNDNILFKEKHYANALEMDTIAPAIEELPQIAANYRNVAEALNAKRMTEREMVEFYVKFYKLDEEQRNFDSRITRLLETYHNAAGQSHLKPTAYKAFQAVTYLNTHHIRATENASEVKMVGKQKDSLKFQQALLAA